MQTKKQSKAIISLYSPHSAIELVSAYVFLNDIRAGQKG